MGVPRLSAEQLKEKHGPDYFEPTEANLRWLAGEGYEHLADAFRLLQAELVVERERAEQYADKGAELVMELAEMRERVREAEMEAAQLGRSYDEERERAERAEEAGQTWLRERHDAQERAERLERALRKIEALRTNEHAAGFDEAREIAAAVLAEQEKEIPRRWGSREGHEDRLDEKFQQAAYYNAQVAEQEKEQQCSACGAKPDEECKRPVKMYCARDQKRAEQEKEQGQ